MGDTLIAGVDGISGGWIAAIEHRGGSTELECFSAFSALLSRGFDLLVVDIPIGLPTASSRDCDVEARRRIGKRRNSVFPAPIREMLSASDHSGACAARGRYDGKRCSKQLSSIIPKIREVDESMEPALQGRVREGHPEFSFTLMNGNMPMSFYKGTREGEAERLQLLQKYFSEIHINLAKLSSRSLRTDAIDAYALLWSARRVISKRGDSIPALPQLDARGLRAEIIA